MESVYIFLYSERDNQFESSIEKACSHLGMFKIRARYIAERDVKIYTFLSTCEEIEKLNNLLTKNREEEILSLLSKRTLIIT